MTRYLLLACIAIALPLNAATFNVHEQTADAKGKIKMVKTVLLIEDDSVQIGDRTFTREAVKEVTYSRAKSPRTKSAIGIGIICLPCGIATAFMKGKKHWLTLQDDNGFAILRLEKGNHMQITAAVEAALNVNAERIIE